MDRIGELTPGLHRPSRSRRAFVCIESYNEDSTAQRRVGSGPGNPSGIVTWNSQGRGSVFFEVIL